MANRKVLVVLMLVAAFLFVAPIIPIGGNPLQFAGFFPRYASVTCFMLHVGVAYGPNSFVGNKWVLSPFCGI